MLSDKAQILCDDRIIVRRSQGEFKIHGTWSHGDVPEVSASSVSLGAIMFLQQAKKNTLVPVDDKQDIIRNLLSCLVKPLVTADWWEKMLTLVGNIAREVPCYDLYFDRSGRVVDVIQEVFGED
jgi:hypothetical protein